MSLRHLGLTMLVGAVACGGGKATEPDPDPDPQPTNTPGTTNHTITVEGSQRAFVVHVGATVGASTAVPVVFMFHGTSGDGPQFFNQSGWREMADQEGFIAVFPSSLTYCFYEDENKDGDFLDNDERKITTKWTHGDLGNPAVLPLCTAGVIATLSAPNRALVDHPLRDDVAFVDAMVALLKQQFRIDPKAVYSSGFSNGAQFSNRLAVERSTTFAATAAHAGGTSVPPTTGRTLSVVSSVGTLDDRYTVPLGVTEIPLAENTLVNHPILTAIFVAPLLTQLQLTTAYTYDELTIGGKRVGRWVFRTSKVGATNTLTFSLFKDNFHTYPNGTGYPVRMANLLWEFFRTQRVP